MGIAVAVGLLMASTPALARAAVPAPVGPPAVLPLGDSITYGTSWAGYALPVPQVETPGGYRGFLASDLAASGQAFVYTGSRDDNPPVGAEAAEYRQEGHPGYRIDQLGTGLAGWSGLSPGRPSVVILMVGTNDISEGYDPAGSYPPGGYSEVVPAERAQFVDHMVGRLTQLLKEIQQVYSKPRVVLCTIPPMGLTSPDPTGEDYDRAVRDQVVPWAGRQGVPVVLADVGAAFMGQATYHDLIGPDGVHPTPLGYRLMASVIAPAVAAALSRGPA